MTTLAPSVIRSSGNSERASQNADSAKAHFKASPSSTEATLFGPIRAIIEGRLEPNTGFATHAHRNAEIVTYIASGALTHTDSLGQSGLIRTGEMHRLSAGYGIIHEERNEGVEPERQYQIWIVPDRLGASPSEQQLLFTPQERASRLRLYVSPDGRSGSMQIYQDVFIHSGLFKRGDTMPFLLMPGRGLWIQVVSGQVDVTGEFGLVNLAEGDGAGITDAWRIDLSFLDASEVLLLDVAVDAHLATGV
jgi:redox-sensitive bicupin YhaK (pirin superfamily)